MKEIEMSDIDELGMKFFGSKVKYNHWFSIPHFSLGKQKPSDLVKTAKGREEVYSTLVRMSYGILA